MNALVSFRPGCFTPEERIPGTHWIGGLVGSRSGLGAVEKVNPLTLLIIEPRFPGRSAGSFVVKLTEITLLRLDRMDYNVEGGDLIRLPYF
jgi:hypothetical protein